MGRDTESEYSIVPQNAGRIPTPEYSILSQNTGRIPAPEYSIVPQNAGQIAAPLHLIDIKTEKKQVGHLSTEILKPYSSLAEERQITGRYVALGVAISLITLGLYHAWEQKIAVLAGLFVPALIMFLYILWILYSANKDARRLRRLQALRSTSGNLIEVISQPSSISRTSSLSKLSISSKCSNHQHHCHNVNLINATAKPLSKSVSKSSLISSKHTIVNVHNTAPKKNTANIFHPDTSKSVISNNNIKSMPSSNNVNSTVVNNDNKLIENDVPVVKQQFLTSKYQARLKRQLQKPLRVHSRQLPTPSIPKSLGRTYSIA